METTASSLTDTSSLYGKGLPSFTNEHGETGLQSKAQSGDKHPPRYRSVRVQSSLLEIGKEQYGTVEKSKRSPKLRQPRKPLKRTQKLARSLSPRVTFQPWSINSSTSTRAFKKDEAGILPASRTVQYPAARPVLAAPPKRASGTACACTSEVGLETGHCTLTNGA